MNISATDYFLIRFCQSSPRLLQWIGDWETQLLATELNAINVSRPVFICGLARSGSTMLLELLSRTRGVATHRYRDFPFLSIPYFWNRYLNMFPSPQQPVERPHKDRVQITRESPEAMEEPIWMSCFPHLHAKNAVHRLAASTENLRFEQHHRTHLRKILLIRSGTRYVAKNNYHVTRIEYLARLYPDAEFLIPIRHPLAQVDSLVKQHRLFCEYSRRQPRVERYMEAAGHFEFGPQRVPIRLDAVEGNRILSKWQQGEDAWGYGIQWKEIYGFVRTLRQNSPDLSSRMHLVRYEDFCSAPEYRLNNMLGIVGLTPPEDALISPNQIFPSERAIELTSAEQAAIRHEVTDVAEYFGYACDGKT